MVQKVASGQKIKKNQQTKKKKNHTNMEELAGFVQYELAGNGQM